MFVQYVLVYLLPQSKALQPDSHSFSRQNRRREMHFNFGLVFTHDTYKQKKRGSKMLEPRRLHQLLTCFLLFLIKALNPGSEVHGTS